MMWPLSSILISSFKNVILSLLLYFQVLLVSTLLSCQMFYSESLSTTHTPLPSSLCLDVCSYLEALLTNLRLWRSYWSMKAQESLKEPWWWSFNMHPLSAVAICLLLYLASITSPAILFVSQILQNIASVCCYLSSWHFAFKKTLRLTTKF